LVAVSQETVGLMIDRREILEAASSFSLLPSIVEKDYVLGWMLAGINAHGELGESWVFKGGPVSKSAISRLIGFQKIWILPCAIKGIRNPNSIRVRARAAASCSQVSTKRGTSSRIGRPVGRNR
jgi:hypothetical protein